MGGVTTIGEQPKACGECGTIKPAEAFYVARGMRDGRMKKCRDCANEAQRVYREREKIAAKTLLRGVSIGSRGELHDETIVVRRNEYIGLLAAAADRWRKADDQEEQDGAREALLFRCRQLLEAEGMVST